MVARAGVGFDRVDVPACTRHGVAVTITPTANHEAVAEQAFALIFAFAKKIVANDRRFSSPPLDTEEKFSFQFGAPGAYPYYCSVHPTMTGTVVVKAR